jgi:glyoxalase/bleomycin resistance protein/dioxygenase superfamily protein
MAAMTAAAGDTRLVTGIRQVCLVVADFNAAVAALSSDYGIGPWKCWALNAPRLFDTELDGRPGRWTMKLGVAWIGSSQLEVIQPLEGDSIYRRFLQDAPGGGIQHILVETGHTRFEAAIERLGLAGFPVAQAAGLNLAGRLGAFSVPKLPGFLRGLATRFAYLHSATALGTTLELSKMPPGLSFERGIALAKADRTVPADVAGGARWQQIDSVALAFNAEDADAARDAYERRAGIWPWRDLAGSGELGPTWRCELKRTAIELIRPPSTGPIREHLDRHGPGVHHLGVAVPTGDLDQAVRQLVAAGCAELLRTRHPVAGQWVLLSSPVFGDTRLALHATTA